MLHDFKGLQQLTARALRQGVFHMQRISLERLFLNKTIDHQIFHLFQQHFLCKSINIHLQPDKGSRHRIIGFHFPFIISCTSSRGQVNSSRIFMMPSPPSPLSYLNLPYFRNTGYCGCIWKFKSAEVPSHYPPKPYPQFSLTG